MENLRYSFTLSWAVGLTILLCSIQAFGEIIHVRSMAAGKADGSSWQDAFPQLQFALDLAAKGDEIWVAAGRYVPSSDYGLVAGNPADQVRLRHFRLINGVAIYGGFAGTESRLEQRDSKANPTVLSGDILQNDFLGAANRAENCYHVFYHPEGLGLDETAILDGVTIGDGEADLQGGGMCNLACSATLIDCLFTNNRACLGGGAYNQGGAPVFLDCKFISNTTRSGCSGGGMYNLQAAVRLENCEFRGNQGYHYSGGLFNDQSSPAIVNCLFIGNYAEGSGGGITNYHLSSPLIRNCRFEANEIGRHTTVGGQPGGAGILNLWESSPEIVDCVFTGNKAYNGRYGGGVYNLNHSVPSIENCSFLHNAAETGGGGGLCNGNASPAVTGCQFSGNQALYGAGLCNLDDAAPQVSDCVFTQNQTTGASTNHGGGGIYNLDSQPELTRCELIANDACYGGGICNRGSNAIIRQCLIQDNTASKGAGLFNENSVPVISRSRIDGNTARHRGGGMYNLSSSPKIANTVLYCNGATAGDGRGGGFYNKNSSPQVIHCTLSGNYDSGVGSGFYNESASSPVVVNSILDDGYFMAEVYNSSDSVSQIACCAGNVYTGTGNTFLEPEFVDKPNGDLRLRKGSLCIDSADNEQASGLTTDVMGTPRLLDGDGDELRVADKGAYEYYTPGDLNNMGGVDGMDLVQFASSWLATDCQSPDNCAQADIDRNGRVEISDFSWLASFWLQ